MTAQTVTESAVANRQEINTIVDNIRTLRDRNDPGLIGYLNLLNRRLSSFDLAQVKKALLS